MCYKQKPLIAKHLFCIDAGSRLSSFTTVLVFFPVRVIHVRTHYSLFLSLSLFLFGVAEQDMELGTKQV